LRLVVEINGGGIMSWRGDGGESGRSERQAVEGSGGGLGVERQWRQLTVKSSGVIGENRWRDELATPKMTNNNQQ